MTIGIKENGTDLVLEITGRLDTATAPTLDKAIKEKLENAKSLILDFKGLEYISSAGLRVILGAQKAMKQKGTMKVINVRELVMEVFEVTGFSEILTIE